jgi:hypothetical protein
MTQRIPMKTIITSLIALTATLPLLSAAEAKDPFLPAKKLTAQLFDSNFHEGHDTYNGMGTGSDGCIYYVLSTEPADIGGRMFKFDPKTQKVTCVGDLTEACGEKGKKTVVQGKSHVNFVEANGKLYFATHIGYYSIIDGMEKMGIPPAGWTKYPGGHLLSYDLKTGKFEDFGRAPDGEGVITFNMDTKHGRMFGVTWPAGMFFRYDMATKNLKNFGKTCREGENGKGAAYSTVCRAIAVDPEDGSAYYSTGDGDIFQYRADTDSVTKLEDEDLKKDYFGIYDSTNPGHMGYNWRQMFYRPKDKMFYGVHGNSGYLFRFDPRTKRIQVLDRITSDPSKASGMFDQFSYGYLGFALGADGDTICYLTGGPIYKDGKRLKGKDRIAMGAAKGLEDLHLVTYHIPTGRVRDQGAIYYKNGERPLYVNSIAVGKDGSVYSLARVPDKSRVRADLFCVKGPFNAK